MKLKDFGAFIWKEDANNIFFCMYVKTNFLMNKFPNAKLMGGWDGESFIRKDHSPNKIWMVIFDKDGRDYPGSEDMSFDKFEEAFEDRHLYNYDYFTPITLYKELKKSGLNRRFTQKWFTGKFAFIKGQLDKAV
jgi:hypothetical protein